MLVSVVNVLKSKNDKMKIIASMVNFCEKGSKKKEEEKNMQKDINYSKTQKADRINHMSVEIYVYKMYICI